MTSFYLNDLWKDPISKYILRCWGLFTQNSTREFLGRHNSTMTGGLDTHLVLWFRGEGSGCLHRQENGLSWDQTPVFSQLFPYTTVHFYLLLIDFLLFTKAIMPIVRYLENEIHLQIWKN